jgi:hypothetical protein
MEKQFSRLSHEDGILRKFTTVGNSPKTEVILNKKDVSWNRELAPFSSLNLINKPVYRGRYKVSTFQDPKSNLKIKCWEAKGGEPIRRLKIYYLDNPAQIKRVEAMVESNSPIFSTNKVIEMEFSILGGGGILESYRLSGSQRFFNGTRELFLLESFIGKK